MSYTNSTTHYALPLPTGSDKSLFTDTNQAFQDIDAAIYSAETVANQAGTDITAIKATIINLQNVDVTFQNDITSLKGRMTAVEGVASQNTTDIADVRHDAEDMITAHNEATATSATHYDIGDEFIYNDVLYRATAEINIGDTIVPNTNCSATNVMTEVNTINTALSGKMDILSKDTFEETTDSNGLITLGKADKTVLGARVSGCVTNLIYQNTTNGWLIQIINPSSGQPIASTLKSGHIYYTDMIPY